MSVRTSFEDLAKLGHTRRQIQVLVDEKRGGTLRDLHLNDDWAHGYGWYCYNSVLGQAVKVGSRPRNVEDTVVVADYDNSENDRELVEEWEESITTGTTATLSITNSASITLESRITIASVAESGFSMTTSTESTNTETVEETTTTTRRFTIEVGPHEIVKILRTKTEVGEIATYHVPYGLNRDGMIGSSGTKPYNGHWDWAYNLNWLLGSPTGHIELSGSSKNTNYLFKVVRSGGKGPTSRSKVHCIDPNSGKEIELDTNAEYTKVDQNVRHGW